MTEITLADLKQPFDFCSVGNNEQKMQTIF